MWDRFLYGKLMDEGGEGDGGGAGSGTGGDNSGTGGTGADGSSGITKEFLTSSLNSVSAGLRSELSKKTIPNALKTHVEPLIERVAALEEAVKTGSGSGAGEGDGGEGSEGHKIPADVQTKLSNYEKQIKTLQAGLEQVNKDKAEADAKAKAASKSAAIATVLQGLEQKPVNDRSAKSLQSLCENACFYNEDGDLVAEDDAGNEIMAEAWIKEVVPRDFGGLLAARGARGSGTGRGAENGGTGRVSLEDIKPGMPIEEKRRVYAAIAAAGAR